MKAMNNDKFAEAVLRLAKVQVPFRPTAAYIRDGDCIEFVIAPDDYRARRMDGLVTVYYSRETGKVVGSLIKGVSGFCRKMLKQMPGFRIAIEGGTVKLEHIFLAQLWTQPPDPKDVKLLRTYDALISAAGKVDVVVDLDDLCPA